MLCCAARTLCGRSPTPASADSIDKSPLWSVLIASALVKDCRLSLQVEKAKTRDDAYFLGLVAGILYNVKRGSEAAPIANKASATLRRATRSSLMPRAVAGASAARWQRRQRRDVDHHFVGRLAAHRNHQVPAVCCVRFNTAHLLLFASQHRCADLDERCEIHGQRRNGHALARHALQRRCIISPPFAGPDFWFAHVSRQIWQHAGHRVGPQGDCGVRSRSPNRTATWLGVFLHSAVHKLTVIAW